jgi:signal transduction histidine kinase
VIQVEADGRAAEPAEGSHEQQLRRYQAEIEALRRQLAAAQRRATVGTMVAMVAHEFNNILTPVLNYAQLARQKPHLAAKAVEKAADGSQRAAAICRALLGMTAEAPPDPVPVCLADLVAQTLTAMAREPAKDAIDLRVRVPRDLRVTTQPIELQQVLLNLLMNARTAVLAGDGSRRIDVGADAARDVVRLNVRDTGVGIAPDDMPHIFEPHFSTRSDEDSSGGGHGLGLAICRQIVEALGGRIEVQSTRGKGATFTVVLPAGYVDA